MSVINEISFIIYLTCIILYSTLLIVSNRPGSRSRYRAIQDIYKNWVVTRLKDQNHAVVVQALRNIVMGNSSYISALIIVLGILIGLYETFFSRDLDSFFSIISLKLALVKFSINAVLILFCMINFILASRMMNRLTLLFCSYPEKGPLENIDGLSVMQDTFTTGHKHLLMGNRGLFFLVPSLSWLISPVVFIITSISVTFYLIAFHDLRRVG